MSIGQITYEIFSKLWNKLFGTNIAQDPLFLLLHEPYKRPEKNSNDGNQVICEFLRTVSFFSLIDDYNFCLHLFGKIFNQFKAETQQAVFVGNDNVADFSGVFPR